MSFATHLMLCGKLSVAFGELSAVAGWDQVRGWEVLMSTMEGILVQGKSFPHLKNLMFVGVWWRVYNPDPPVDTHHSLSNLSTIVAKLLFLNFQPQDSEQHTPKEHLRFNFVSQISNFD